MWRPMLLLMLMILVAAGCSSQTTTVPVEGIVLLEGKPLPLVSVTLVPQDQDVKPSIAITDNEGVFRPITAGEGLGMVPGQYKVLVISPPGPKSPGVPL